MNNQNIVIKELQETVNIQRLAENKLTNDNVLLKAEKGRLNRKIRRRFKNASR